MDPIIRSKRGFSPAGICVAVFCLLLTVGCVISPRRTLGGGGGTPTPTPSPTATPTPNPAATGKLYVINSTSSTLLRFDKAFTAINNATPAATIAGANTSLNFPNYIALDPAADRLYVADQGDLSILIFDKISTQNGTINLAPTRSIFGGNTTLVSPADVFFDRVRTELYVLDDPRILVFNTASLSTGVNNVAPARTLMTSFAVGAAAIFVDVGNDRLFVADLDGAIAIYDNASTLPTGAITPSRSITGSNTQLANPAGIQLDGLGRLVVSNTGTQSLPPSITIYPASAITAGGNPAPVAQISGSNTGFSSPMQIAVDTFGTGTVYLADANAAKVAVYTNLNTATGNINAAPNRSITGASTGLTAGGPAGVAVDNTR
jgi:sugar lactone lactonase YvrE